MSVMKEEDMRSLISEVTSVKEDEGTEKAYETHDDSLGRGGKESSVDSKADLLFSSLNLDGEGKKSSTDSKADSLFNDLDFIGKGTSSDNDLVKSIRIVVDNGTKVGEHHYELFGARAYLVEVGLWRFIDRYRDVIYNVDTDEVYDTVEFIGENLSSSMEFIDNICDCIKSYLQTIKGVEPYDQDADVFKSFYCLTEDLKDFKETISDCVGNLLDADSTHGGSDNEFGRRKLFECFSVSYSPEADFVHTLINALLDRI